MLTQHIKLNLADLEELSGPAPVLRTEDREIYTQIRARFMACFTPQDILEWQLVNRLVDEVWFIKRYTRHQTLAVERWYQQSLEFSCATAKSPKRKKGGLGDPFRRANDTTPSRGRGFA